MRTSTVNRKSKETDISVSINLDGQGKSNIKTGIAFLDHMLTLFSTHGLFNLSIKAKGDLGVDVHHTNEDVAIVLGEALMKALGECRGIKRFGWAYVPMEEALCRVVLDVSGRAKFILRDNRIIKKALKGSGTDYQWQDMEHFLESFVRNAKLTLHIDVFSGDDFHHTCEAIFKALAKALAQATAKSARIKGIPSSKGRI